MKEISVVIVTWNAKHHLEQCIRSVYKETKNLMLKITVVDNASKDGSMEMVQQNFPEVMLIRNEKNLGFSKANNMAIRKILKERKSDYILFLNVDTVIKNRAIERMEFYLESHSSVGAVAPALILPNRKFQTGSAGYLPSVVTGLNYFLFFSRFFPRMAKPLFIDQAVFSKKNKPLNVDWLSGACLMIRREVIEKIGLMDESYYFYAEDIDLGKRMKQKGMQLHYLPWISILHYHGAIYEKEFKEINTRWLIQLYQYLKKEKGLVEYAFFRFLSIAGFLLRLFLYAIFWFVKRDDFNERKIREIYAFFLFSLTGRM